MMSRMAINANARSECFGKRISVPEKSPPTQARSEPRS
jgi:hypothetical protein